MNILRLFSLIPLAILPLCTVRPVWISQRRTPSTPFSSLWMRPSQALTDALTLTVEADGETYILSHKGSVVPNNAVVESVVSVAMAYAGDSQPIPVMEGSFHWDTNSTDQNLAIHLENPLEEETMLFTILYKGFPTTEVKKISGEPKDLLSLSETELQALLMAIQQSINSLQTLFQ